MGEEREHTPSPDPEEETQKPQEIASTHVETSELVVSGPEANINIHKASYQDFIEIHKYAYQQVLDQAVNQAKASQNPQEETGIVSDTPRKGAFISYSRKDKRYLDELHAQLAHFVRARLITFWDDSMIEPGKRWFDEIQAAIQAAKVAVFLVSPEFLASEFIARKELPPLLAAASQEGTLILSIILRPCPFQLTALSDFQTVNLPSRPLSDMKTRGERDKVWLKVAECIMKAQQPDN
jgi:hypothetical protein